MTTHTTKDSVFDKDCVAVIECDYPQQGRRLAFAYFEDKFSMDSMNLFPRGLIPVNF